MPENKGFLELNGVKRSGGSSLRQQTSFTIHWLTLLSMFHAEVVIHHAAPGSGPKKSGAISQVFIR
jgi:hypothetical protein